MEVGGRFVAPRTTNQGKPDPWVSAFAFGAVLGSRGSGQALAVCFGLQKAIVRWPAPGGREERGWGEGIVTGSQVGTVCVLLRTYVLALRMR